MDLFHFHQDIYFSSISNIIRAGTNIMEVTVISYVWQISLFVLFTSFFTKKKKKTFSPEKKAEVRMKMERLL